MIFSRNENLMRLRAGLGRLAAVCICVALCGCATKLPDIGRVPDMTPVGSGLNSPTVPVAMDGRTRPRAITPGSIWRDESADLFTDPRARRVGDVITVKIQIKDKASFDNSNTRQRDSTQSVGGKFDWATTHNGINLSGNADASFNGSTKTDSQGAIARAETIDLLLAAVVTDVLPNGNMMVTGSQEVRVNYEVRELSIAGVVRPRDIATDNSISYDKIAEARISYGGRGRITEVQQPGVAHQILDLITPF